MGAACGIIILPHIVSISVSLPDADVERLVRSHPPLLKVRQAVRKEPSTEGLVRLAVDGRDVERAQRAVGTRVSGTGHYAGKDTILTMCSPPRAQARYWEDPHEFKPSRFFDGNWNRDAFQPFSLGARACIGKRFVELELAAAIATTISKYKVELPLDVLYPPGIGLQETLRERRERVLKCKYGNTLT